MKELGEKLSKEELADMMNEGNCLIFIQSYSQHLRRFRCRFEYGSMAV